MNKFKPKIGSGDNGYTDIFLSRVPKTDLKIKLNALLDEINAIIGVLRSKTKKNDKELAQLQKEIISLSAFIAGFKKNKELKSQIKTLEQKIKKENIDIKEFVIFGNDYKTAVLNLIRSKIRICEIIAWEAKIKLAAIYLNRLSDYAFILSVSRRF